MAKKIKLSCFKFVSKDKIRIQNLGPNPNYFNPNPQICFLQGEKEKAMSAVTPACVRAGRRPSIRRMNSGQGSPYDINSSGISINTVGAIFDEIHETFLKILFGEKSFAHVKYSAGKKVHCCNFIFLRFRINFI